MKGREAMVNEGEINQGSKMPPLSCSMALPGPSEFTCSLCISRLHAIRTGNFRYICLYLLLYIEDFRSLFSFIYISFQLLFTDCLLCNFLHTKYIFSFSDIISQCIMNFLNSQTGTPPQHVKEKVLLGSKRVV